MGDVIEFENFSKAVTQKSKDRLDRKSRRVINYLQSVQYSDVIIQLCTQLFLENGSYDKTVSVLDTMDEYETDSEVEQLMELYENGEITEDEVPYELMDEMHRIYQIQNRNLCKKIIKKVIEDLRM